MAEGFINPRRNEKPDICGACKGACCKRYPGIPIPEDFGKPLEEKLLIAFASGKWAIDWWFREPWDNSFPTKLWVRPRIVGEPIVYNSVGGRCGMLTEAGCSLPWKSRPHECRTVIPDPNPRVDLKVCVAGKKISRAKSDYVSAWEPHQAILLKIHDLYFDPEARVEPNPEDDRISEIPF